MDTAQAALHHLAAVETVLHPCEKPDEAGAGRGNRVEVRYQWTRSMVECRSLPYEPCNAQETL